MNHKFGVFAALLVSTVLSGGISCGGAEGVFGGNPLPTQIASVEILNCPSSLQVGESKPLSVQAKDAQGQILSNTTFLYDSDLPSIASLSQEVVQARYPGEASVTASAGGLDSAPCVIQVKPPQNTKTVKALTDNLDDDSWGANNNFKTVSRGKVLWRTLLPSGDAEINLGGPQSMAQPLKTVAGSDVDFMALGSGASSGVLASWREDLSNTFASEGLSTPVPLGAQTQEENAIADGCLYFRKGLPENDIARFSIGAGLSTPGTTGDLYGPVTSGCQAVWEERGATESKLVFFDGNSTHPFADGLPAFPSYDFREGRAVYASGNDIFLYDTRTPSAPPVNLTQDPSLLNGSPKTDGHSVVYLRTRNGNAEVVLYGIESQKEQVISLTSDPKAGSSLEIDLKQVIWKEGGSLYFYDGTQTVLVDSFPATQVNEPHLEGGLVVWHSPTGPFTDEEIFTME